MMKMERRSGEIKALRAGRQPGWRNEALAELSRLAVMPTPPRDLVELRTEATATLGTPDIRLVTWIETPPDHLRSIDFSPDGRTLVTASYKTGLDFWIGRVDTVRVKSLILDPGSRDQEHIPDETG
jgi:WD40 repeat protein